MSAPSTGVSNVHEVKNVPLLVQNEEHMCKMCSFDRVPPPLSTYVATGIIQVIKWPRLPPPFVFAYSQSERLEGLATRLH